jgi:hypothetical protein
MVLSLRVHFWVTSSPPTPLVMPAEAGTHDNLDLGHFRWDDEKLEAAVMSEKRLNQHV